MTKSNRSWIRVNSYDHLPKIELRPHPDTGELVPEEWRDVVGFEGKYQVSNYGRVISFSAKSKGYLISTYVQPGAKTGYQRSYLFDSSSSKIKRTSIHRLVGCAFIPNPNGLPEINHINNNRVDNFYLNLEWTDRKGNCEHASRQNRYNIAKGESSHLSKLKENDVTYIRSSKDNVRFLAAKFNVCEDTVIQIIRRETWKHI